MFRRYQKHDFRGLQNPWRFHWSDEFQKVRTFFFGKSCSRDFGAPGCHPSTLINLANTALASKRSVKTICMISEGYRTHRAVTGSMSFKKSGRFLSENRAPGFLEPWLPLNTLIDLANNAPASKRSVKTISFFSEGYRNQRGVTGPTNFKKSGHFFFGKSCSRVLGTWLPFKHFN